MKKPTSLSQFQTGRRLLGLAALVAACGLSVSQARAVESVFFNSFQTTNLVTSGTTSDTISSGGYLFTHSLDKLFTGGVGLTNPIGRYIRVPWPDGLEAQAVTAGPSPSGAKITIKRQDGKPFSIPAFSVKLLANTGGAGAALEVMPKLNGEDAYPDPLMLDATGYYGQTFTYNTAQLTGFDTYDMALYVDYALTSLTVVDDTILVQPTLRIAATSSNAVVLTWRTNSIGFIPQHSPDLNSAGWTNVTNSIHLVGTKEQVLVPVNSSAEFFRLSNPWVR